MAEIGAANLDRTDTVSTAPEQPAATADDAATPADGGTPEDVPGGESRPADAADSADSADSAGEPTDGATPAADDGAADRPKRGRPRKSAAKPKGIELVLTVAGTAEATDWRAEVSHGSKRVVKDLAIPASAVAAAAKDLHPEVAEAIEQVLSAAREQQRSRVEQLQAELEAARRALADLED